MNMTKHCKVCFFVFFLWFLFPALLQMCTVMSLKQTSAAALTGASTKCNFSCLSLGLDLLFSFTSTLLSQLMLSPNMCVCSVGTLETNKGSNGEPGCLAPKQRRGARHWWKLGCAGVDVDKGLTLADDLQLWLNWGVLAVRRAAVCCVFLFSHAWRVCQELLKGQADGSLGGTDWGLAGVGPQRSDPSTLAACRLWKHGEYRTKRGGRKRPEVWNA